MTWERSGIISAEEKTEEDYANHLQKGMKQPELHIRSREDEELLA